MSVIEILKILFDDSNKEELLEKQNFLLRINQMDQEDVIDYLIKIISLKKENGTITEDRYNELLKKVSMINYSKYKTSEQVEERLLWLKKLKLDDLVKRAAFGFKDNFLKEQESKKKRRII